MDDRNFTQEAAKKWISVIEGKGAEVREKDLYPLLSDWIARENPKNALDIGCGQGACSQKIANENCDYLGIDPSKFLINRAKQLHKKNADKFIIGNAYSLPFENGFFDSSFSIALWHLLEDKPKAAMEMSRVLKNSGSFFIATANPDYYESWIKTYESHSLKDARLEGKTRRDDGSESTDILFLHSLEEIMGSLKCADLHVLNSTTFRAALVLQGKKIKPD